MANLGYRIYFDIVTGEVIFVRGERSGDVIDLTPAEERERYAALSQRVESSYAWIDLEYGQYREDFAICTGYHVDLSGDAPQLVFSYPDPEAEPEDPPVYQKPLSEQVALQQAQIDALTYEILSLKGLI